MLKVTAPSKGRIDTKTAPVKPPKGPKKALAGR